jgi:hypothetical protein
VTILGAVLDYLARYYFLRVSAAGGAVRMCEINYFDRIDFFYEYV